MNKTENGRNHIGERIEKITEENIRSFDLLLIGTAQVSFYQSLDQSTLGLEGAKNMVFVLNGRQEQNENDDNLKVAGIVWSLLSQEQRNIIAATVHGFDRFPGETDESTEKIKKRFGLFTTHFEGMKIENHGAD